MRKCFAVLAVLALTATFTWADDSQDAKGKQIDPQRQIARAAQLRPEQQTTAEDEQEDEPRGESRHPGRRRTACPSASP